MRPQLMTNLATYGVLGAAVTVSALLPARLGPRDTRANPPKMTGDTTIDINTVVRDWGPAGYLCNRVVDMTPGVFTRVTGRRLSAGLAPVRVYIY